MGAEVEPHRCGKDSQRESVRSQERDAKYLKFDDLRWQKEQSSQHTIAKESVQISLRSCFEVPLLWAVRGRFVNKTQGSTLDLDDISLCSSA